MEILAIIPARGGSKGIPRKNVRLLGGKPLIAWSIEQAKTTAAITRVVVSTDDAEIAEVSRQFGAEVVWRPAAIAGDTASSESALIHVRAHLRDQESYEPDLIVFLQATSPLRDREDIGGAIETLRREAADSLLSVSPIHGFVWRREGEHLSSFSYDHLRRPRRQDAPEDLIENGSIYVLRPWVLDQLNNRLGGKISIHRMNPLDSFQVDEPGDLELMEHLLSYRRGGERPVDWAAVRLLVLDFDGVMTDNRVLVCEDGTESVQCDRGDGLGLSRLRKAGVEVLVLSKERNPVVTARCRKLDLPVVQSCDDKLGLLRSLALERGLAAAQVAFVGNDLNDLDCLRWAGVPVAVADAYAEAKAAACWVTRAGGGRGAVREVCEQILKQLNR